MRPVCLTLSCTLGRLLSGQSAYYRSHTRASPAVLTPPPCRCSGGVERKELAKALYRSRQKAPLGMVYVLLANSIALTMVLQLLSCDCVKCAITL